MWFSWALTEGLSLSACRCERSRSEIGWTFFEPAEWWDGIFFYPCHWYPHRYSDLESQVVGGLVLPRCLLSRIVGNLLLRTVAELLKITKWWITASVVPQ